MSSRRGPHGAREHIMSDRTVDFLQMPGAEERDMLRRSIRSLLATHWPPERKVEMSTQPECLTAIWKKLSDLGVTALGSNPAEGGMSEIATVMEELGRASCPAPFLGAAIVNLALTPRPPAPPRLARL